MLDTILHVGKLISEGRDPWEDIIDTVEPDTKSGKVRPLQLDFVFDLDENTVRARVVEFDGRFPHMKRMGAVKIRGGRFKAIYPAVPSSKIIQISKTLFGKEGDTEGEMKDVIDQKYPDLKQTLLYEVLRKVFSLKKYFDEWVYDKDKSKYSYKIAETRLELGKQDKIEYITTKIKWVNEDIHESYLCEVQGFELLIQEEFFPSRQKDNSYQKIGLDYSTGFETSGLEVPNFYGRYNINKFFVQETCNYATGFDKKYYDKNYQLNTENRIYLDRGSTFFLDNYKVKIANLDHVILPQVLHKDLGELTEEVLTKIHTKADLLFRLHQVSEFVETLEDDVDYFWLNFVAIDSDGNYFKVANLIKDVPCFHFEGVIKNFFKAGKVLRPWLGERYLFNVGRMYFFIPVRKDQKKNRALLLFASLLEQRKIDSTIIFQHFNELILCHWYERYRAYANIRGGTDFDFLAKDAVFIYLAFFLALRNLQLLKDNIFMDANQLSKSISEQIAQDEKDFLFHLGYTNHQQALFYLGRALSRVAYAQSRSEHNKPVLNKLNYNGMDRRSIVLLANDLMEKGNQYKNKDKHTLPIIEKYLNAFFGLFPANEDDWHTSPQEALFFILSGYTYGIKSKNQSETIKESTHE